MKNKISKINMVMTGSYKIINKLNEERKLIKLYKYYYINNL